MKLLAKIGTKGRDCYTPEQRSYVMSRIRSRGNKTTELRLIALMRLAGIIGWRRRQKLPGSPDFVFRKQRLAVFVDGCFWHGCPGCYRRPVSNRKYWQAKIHRNRQRDRSVCRVLRKAGWRVVRIREHDLSKRPALTLRRIAAALKPPA